MMLDVQVKGNSVAKLYRERDEYVLAYNEDVGETDFVSLTMPVRKEPWRWPRDLHPFFRQNLPEGYLLDIIREEFGPFLDGTDLSLLAVVGGMGIGRVTVTPEGVAPGTDLDPLDIEALTTGDNTADRFASLVRKYARSAVSGAVPKFLAPGDSQEVARPPLGKPTIRTSRHLIKGSDERTPYLGFNEHYSMMVLDRLKVVPVARTRMSGDGRLLIVDRFDVDQDGLAAFGLEDSCSLLGLPPHEKYGTTMERVVNALRPYFSGAAVNEQWEQLGWLVLTNFVVRNADCHSKNIAIYYSSRGDVRLTPCFDIVTTQAYPRYAANPPGLSIEGRKNWAPGKSLEKFFKGRLGISPRKYAEMVDRVCESAVVVGQEVISVATAEPRWHNVAKQMLHAWKDGIQSLRDPGRTTKPFLALDLEAAGFSDPDPPERPEVIGRSELLARPRKRR